jgi:hypothetical protein
MSLSSDQLELYKHILEASKTSQSDQIVYISEYLGYLPFGVYHWVECTGENISNDFPTDWQQADLVALEDAGLLVRLQTWQNPEDKFHGKTTFRVCG